MIRYVKGDATRPEGSGKRFIVHVCNDAGGWGAGFVVALSRRWRDPERKYREWASKGAEPRAGRFELGSVQWVSVQSLAREPDGFDSTGVWVANMVAQKGYGSRNAKHRDEAEDADSHLPPIRYEALEQCLDKVGEEAVVLGASVHMPRIGCSLAGGSWAKVAEIVERTLCARGVPVTVYDFPGSTFNP